MIGALLGDIVGSKYEFNNIKTKDFPLFSSGCFMTDDSIMTLAVCEIMQKKYHDDQDKIIDTFKKWGRAYPDRGYGLRFSHWLFSDNRKSYNSLGNGAAMRISPVGWYAQNEEEVKKYAKAVTEVTHSHPEGLKAAEVVAMCVYYARIGKSKEFIRKYVSKYYSLDFDYEDLKRNYEFSETSQDTVPQAIYCFLISNSIEDCLRTTISIGGDCDTTAAISCAIAEAYYKDMDQELLNKIITYIPKNEGECSPLNVICKFRIKKVADDSMTEEILPETKFVVEISKSDTKTFATWFYSKSYRALASSLIYYTFESYFDIDDGAMLNENITSASDLNNYIDEIGFNTLYRGELYEITNYLRPYATKFFYANSKEEFNGFLKIYNETLKKIGISTEYILFDSRDEALKFLKENFGDDSELYNDIFCRYYEKLTDKD